MSFPCNSLLSSPVWWGGSCHLQIIPKGEMLARRSLGWLVWLSCCSLFRPCLEAGGILPGKSWAFFFWRPTWV